MYLWLKTLWYRRFRGQGNCLYVVGDGDELYLIDEIERAFSIDLHGDPEILEAINMGLLFDIVLKKVKEKKIQVEEQAVWDDLCSLVATEVRYDGSIDRQTTFFYYT